MVQLSTSWQKLNSKKVSYYNAYTGDFQLWARIVGTQDITNNRTKVEYQWYHVLEYGWITADQAQDYVTGAGWNSDTYREYTSTKVLRSWEGWISHNADGTGSGSCSGRTIMSTMGVDTDWVSASYTLPTIPRASQPTASPNPLTIGSSGATLTVNTNRKSSSFTHTIKVQCGSWSWTSTARSVGASVNVTIPYSVIAQFSATSKTATATVTCTTFNGTTQIASAKTCSVTFQVNSSVDHANVGTITVQDTNARTSAVTQDNSIYIANISTLEATIPLTVSGSYTELASATVTCGSETETFPLSGTSQTITFTFDKVNASSLSVTVKDKRGNSVTGSKSWTLIQYKPITLTATVGRPSATGSAGVGQITGMAYGGEFGATQNSVNVEIDFKLHDDVDYDPQYTETDSFALTQSGYNSYTESYSFTYQFDYQYQYDVRFTISDLFSTAVYTAQMMQGLPIISWDETEVDIFGDLHIHDRDDPYIYQNVMDGFDALMAHGSQKNLADFNPQTTTVQGITYAVGGDGTVKITGTATAYSSLNVGIFSAVDGETYILNGCATGGDSRTFSVGVGNVHDYGDGAVVTGSGKQIIYVDVFNGETVDLTMHIMVRDARIAAEEFSKPLLKTGYFTSSSVSLTAGNSTSTTVDIVVPDGYRILAILRSWTNGNILINYISTSTFSSRWSQNGNTATCTVWLRNTTSSTTSVTASVEVLFIRA